MSELKYYKSDVIKLTVDLILCNENMPKICKSRTLYFEDKYTFNCIKDSLKIKRNNGIFFKSQSINSKVFKIFFPNENISDFLKIMFQWTWFEFKTENLDFVDSLSCDTDSENENQSTCEGCIQGYGNQMGHMGVGGCLS